MRIAPVLGLKKLKIIVEGIVTQNFLFNFVAFNPQNTIVFGGNDNSIHKQEIVLLHHVKTIFTAFFHTD